MNPSWYRLKELFHDYIISPILPYQFPDNIICCFKCAGLFYFLHFILCKLSRIIFGIFLAFNNICINPLVLNRYFTLNSQIKFLHYDFPSPGLCMLINCPATRSLCWGTVFTILRMTYFLIPCKSEKVCLLLLNINH